MSIQQNYPNIRPSMSIDFAGTKQLDPRITYSRASTGTYYDGKTAAKAEENLLVRSQEFSSASWFKLGIVATADTTVAPDGTSTADTLTPTASAGRHITYQSYVTASAGQVFTLSVYVKPNGHNYVALGFEPNTNGVAKSFIFDLSLVSASVLHNSGENVFANASATITSAGNGWFRCTMTSTSVAALSNFLTIQFGSSPIAAPAVEAGMPTFTGDGTSGAYLWGAQLEQRSFATAYTPTTTAPITNYIPVLQTASAGTPRFDHNPITGESLGLLVEEQRTNLLTYSSDFDNANWLKANTNVMSSVGIAPNGTQTVQNLIPTTNSTQHFITQNFITSGTTTFSVYAKAAGYVWLGLTGSGSGFTTFNLSSGTVGTVGSGVTASITSVGNGWYRCSVTQTYVSQTNYIFVEPSDAQATFAGNGFSGIYIWGAQLETGAFATSYIPTALTYSGRASAGTFRGPNGLLQTAAINAPRYEVNAGGGSNLLLENASSNLLKYTEHFDNDVWGKNRVIAVSNQVAAPDGSSTADILTATTGTSDSIYQAVSVSNAVHTISFWIKGVGNTNSAAFGVITSGFIASTATVLSGPGTASGTTFLTITGLSEKEWTRVSFTTNAAFGAGICGFYIYPGGGNTANASVALWGAQFELGSTATSYIPSLETFTGRASTATYYDSTGIIRTAASGQPRYSYNPSLLSVAPKLLLEAQGTNLLTFSEQFDDATWVKASSATVTANAIAAPNGLIAADLVTTTGGSSQVYQQQVLSNGTYTFSVYVKRSTSDLFMLDLSDSSTGDAIVSYSLDNGTITSAGSGGYWSGTSGTIQNVGNGWYRCTLTATKGAGSSIIAKLQPTLGAGAFYLWGAQLETGSGATSYIPTVASQVTRVADTSTSAAQSRAADVYSSSQVTRAVDSASMTGTNFSSWYNQSEGTLYGEAASANIASENVVRFVVAAFDNIGYTNAVRLERLVGLARDVQTVNNISNSATVAWSANTSAKLAGTYANNNNAFAFNTTTSGFVFPVPYGINKLGIGGSGEGNNVWCGSIKKISYYPRRLTNTQIQALTT